MDDRKKELIERAKADGVQFVSLQLTDVNGAIKNITIPVSKLDEALEHGIWFDGSSIQGFTRIYESDMFMMPDVNTYRVLPWTEGDHRLARIICDAYTPDGKPFEGDPRGILKRVLQRAEALGYRYTTSSEPEFFLFRRDDSAQPVPHDVAGYFDFSPRDLASEVRQDIILALEALGIDVERGHHEVATGQHEINFRYADALSSADILMTFKYTVKAIAQAHELYATFMPKPIAGINGSGMHTHQSLFKGDTNLFFEANDNYHLSPLAYHFLAGQLQHARGLAAVVAPTVNSYKRLVPGYEAPCYICWGQINRSALIRIPRYSKGRESSTRMELRCPDPSSNPYLMLAVMLAAGLDGVERELQAPAAIEESAYELTEDALRERSIGVLPGSLGEALAELEKDPVVCNALGEHGYKAFMRAKRREWDEYRLQVSQWEWNRYFETV
ncbi:MAG: glutamine synthetase family protein [Chloroflexi bacterium]|nr:glutamine synthetase family protein [Chloroflexota bacterium]